MKHYISHHLLITLQMVLFFFLVSCGTPSTKETTAATSQFEKSEQESASPCITGIIPGISLRADVINQWGDPTNTYFDEEGIENLEYDSQSNFLSNKVFIVEDTVLWINRFIGGEITLTDLVSRYGQPEQVTYSFFAQQTRTYLYPQKGFTAVVNEESDKVYLLRCFIPMSLEDYLPGMENELPLENPFTH